MVRLTLHSYLHATRQSVLDIWPRRWRPFDYLVWTGIAASAISVFLRYVGVGGFRSELTILAVMFVGMLMPFVLVGPRGLWFVAAPFGTSLTPRVFGRVFVGVLKIQLLLALPLVMVLVPTLQLFDQRLADVVAGFLVLIPTQLIALLQVRRHVFGICPACGDALGTTSGCAVCRAATPPAVSSLRAADST